MEYYLYSVLILTDDLIVNDCTVLSFKVFWLVKRYFVFMYQHKNDNLSELKKKKTSSGLSKFSTV